MCNRSRCYWQRKQRCLIRWVSAEPLRSCRQRWWRRGVRLARRGMTEWLPDEPRCPEASLRSPCPTSRNGDAKEAEMVQLFMRRSSKRVWACGVYEHERHLDSSIEGPGQQPVNGWVREQREVSHLLLVTLQYFALARLPPPHLQGAVKRQIGVFDGEFGLICEWICSYSLL